MEDCSISSANALEILQSSTKASIYPCIIILELDLEKFDGLVQDCSNSSALAMELLQSCTNPSIYGLGKIVIFDNGIIQY